MSEWGKKGRVILLYSKILLRFQSCASLCLGGRVKFLEALIPSGLPFPACFFWNYLLFDSHLLAYLFIYYIMWDGKAGEDCSFLHLEKIFRIDLLERRVWRVLHGYFCFPSARPMRRYFSTLTLKTSVIPGGKAYRSIGLPFTILLPTLRILLSKKQFVKSTL